MVKARRSSKPGKTSPAGGLITATIDAATGRVVDVRSVDEAGASTELTTDRRATLSRQSGAATLEDLFEQAFEAGIACVLGDDADSAEAEESKDDAALRQRLLRSMIENSAARRLMRNEVVGRAIVGTLIRKSTGNDRGAAPSRSSTAA
jgi:hypothetical protein